MSERALRRRVIRDLASLNAIAVENPALPGTPDVNYVEGWIELKQVERWPPLGGTLNLPHYTPKQRIWLSKRWDAGGNAYLFLQVGSDFLLFDGKTAARVVGKANRAQLEAVAIKLWQKRYERKELIECLSRAQI